MPQTQVVFYKERRARSVSVPVLEWLNRLRATNLTGWARVTAKLERLERFGHELRRPDAENLGQGIYELRARMGSVNYRILYSFHGREVAVLLAGLVKERKIPEVDLKRAQQRRKAFDKNPDLHTYRQGDED